MPADRNLGHRRVRVGGVALALMLLALGAALSGIALMSVSHTRAYLAVSRRLAAGDRITPDVLRSVRLPSAPGLRALPASEVDSVIGKYASITLFPGSLLVPDDIMSTPVPSGMYQVGVHLPPGGLPSPELKPGDKLLLFPHNPATPPLSVIVVSVGIPNADGVQLSVAVTTQAASRTISTLNIAGGLTAALEPDGG